MFVSNKVKKLNKIFYGNLYLNSKKPLKDSIYLKIQLPKQNNEGTGCWTIKAHSIFGSYDFIYFEFLSDLAPKELIKLGDNLELFIGERKVGTVVIRN